MLVGLATMLLGCAAAPLLHPKTLGEGEARQSIDIRLWPDCERLTDRAAGHCRDPPRPVVDATEPRRGAGYTDCLAYILHAWPST